MIKRSLKTAKVAPLCIQDHSPKYICLLGQVYQVPAIFSFRFLNALSFRCLNLFMQMPHCIIQPSTYIYSGRSLKSKQRVLQMKHRETKDKVSELGVGGGVCIWPDMDNMRLTQSETLWLVVTNLLLMPLTIWAFYCLHGELLEISLLWAE